jgi:hypothetical protein
MSRRSSTHTKWKSGEKVMMKRNYPWVIVLGLFAVLLLVLTLFRPGGAEGGQQYPIMDKVANKVILKYEQSSCQQLQEKASQKAPPTPEEIRAVQFLHSDAQMRVYFINKVAPPIANKMFECGMIP